MRGKGPSNSSVQELRAANASGSWGEREGEMDREEETDREKGILKGIWIAKDKQTERKERERTIVTDGGDVEI